MISALLFIAAALFSALATGLMVSWARRRALLDVPNERSSHTRPTPTGAGAAIVAATIGGVAMAWLLVPGVLTLPLAVALVFATGVAVVSWIDDRRPLSPLVRLLVHTSAAAAFLAAAGSLPSLSVPYFGVVAFGVMAPILSALWIIGLTNAYNFMDGVDGIAGAQGVVAGVTWGVAGSLAGEPGVAATGWVLAGACLGFLRHNWAPARIFMGDVGAAFLGFLLAALTIVASVRQPALAIVGICTVWPFVFDTAFTLARRAMRGENLLEAHRKHLYQRLTIAGWSHAAVSRLYGAAAVASSAAGLAAILDAPVDGTLTAFVLPGVALALWGLTVSEEWRRDRALEVDPRAAIAGFNPFVRNRYILLADVLLVVFAAFAAFAMRFDGVFVLYRKEFPLFLAIAVFVKPIIFLAFGLYQRYWRYAGVWDLVAVVLAVSAAEILVGTAMLGTIIVQRQMFDHIIEFPRSVLAIDWLVTLTCAGGVRMAVRVFGESPAARARGAASERAVKRVLIAGAGDAGVLVLREIQRNPGLRMQVVGFLDDDPAKRGKRIHATRVLGPLASLVDVAATNKVDEVIIALPRASGAIVRDIIDACRTAGIPSTSVPGVYELLDGHITISRLRKVEIGDLLRRTPVEGASDMAGYLSGETVLVTGAGGSIGSELCHQIAYARPARLVLVGHGENSIFAVRHELLERARGLNVETIIADVRDAARLRHIFARVRPSAVFHAAAHKHVPLMEGNPEEAITNNVFGTRNVVDAAIEAGVQRLVLISTDKAVEPSSVMGATKRIAEKIVTDAARQYQRAFVVVRFGNVLGSRGSVVPTFKRQIELGQPISITHPAMKRYFMTIPEAVHLVLQAGGLGRGGESFVLNMGEPIAIVDLAKDLIRLSGLNEDDIPIVFTGLRPGEKLEENLWEPGASVQPTDNPDVLRVVEPPLLKGEVGEILSLLQSAVDLQDRTAVLFALSSIVPTLPPDSRAVYDLLSQ